MKDGDDAGVGGALVESPIFQHKHFERLETEGERKMGAAIRRVRQAIARLTPPFPV